MIPKIIHQIWVGADPLPDRFARLVERVRDMHPAWEHRLWTEDNLPDGMIRDEWRERLRYPAERSDLLRLELLYAYGGVYLDVDFDFRKPLDPLLDIAPIVIADIKEARLNNAFMAAEPRHPLIRTLVEKARPREFFGFEKSACGPLFVDKILAPEKQSGQIAVLPYTSFYPVLPEEQEQCYALHLAERSWKHKDDWKTAALLAEERLRVANQRIRELERGTAHPRLLSNRARKRAKRLSNAVKGFFKRERKRLVRGTRLARHFVARRVSHLSGMPLHRDYLPHFFNRNLLIGAGAEIGVKRGAYSEIILANWRGERLYLVDPWEEQDETYVDRANVDQGTHDAYYAQTLERLSRFNGRFEVLRTYSLDAAARLPDGSLDFVYLDARHDYESVLEDLRAWEPKVREGGVVSGHDYLRGIVNGMPYGVRDAVRDFARERGIDDAQIRRTLEPWPTFYWVKAPRGRTTGTANDV